MLKIKIMACKERKDNVEKMLSSLWKKAEVVRDTDKNACHTLCRALDSDNAMIIMEDDIELCKNFYEKAMNEIEKRPNSFIMFYSSRKQEIDEKENQEKGLPYSRLYVTTQAYYVPSWIWKTLTEFLKTNWHANNHRWSIWISKWLIRNWIERYLVQPSLVQHLNNGSVYKREWVREILHKSWTYKYE